jgi:PadR family transcriptional regulator PadR
MMNYAIVYPALLKLGQEGYIASEWRVSENSRKARSTRAGRAQLRKETRQHAETAGMTPRFFAQMESM